MFNFVLLFLQRWFQLTAVIRPAPFNDFLSYSKVKFRWKSIKCFHDDTPLLLAAIVKVYHFFYPFISLKKKCNVNGKKGAIIKIVVVVVVVVVRHGNI